MRKKQFIALGLTIAVLMGAAFAAWAKKDAKYIGSQECMACHIGSHGELIDGYKKTAHASAMADAAKTPAAVKAKFDADSPIKKADIKYVLGSPKSNQNYLDKDFKVLAGKWMAKGERWAPAANAGKDGVTQCVGCHTTNFEPVKKTWTQMGVGCESCHGPGEEHADSMEADDIVNLKKLDSKQKSMVCGQCHSVGTDPSGKYAFPVDFTPGEDLTKSFKLKEGATKGQNNQYNQFITSKHYAGGMACVNCHDPHGDKSKAAHQLRQPINEGCLACHAATIKSMKDHAPSAGPQATCATCHMPDASHEFKKTE
ncbi:MAG: hypothetical protein GX141_06035 [Armatimonadetes bacterium]|jgi:predicted CXXCH cytochrome family protein|nr:hypothetical protein [Armatimonadota bacterium]